nr:hypothetical protein SYMBAF_90112 [Serratia symbiotica]
MITGFWVYDATVNDGTQPSPPFGYSYVSTNDYRKKGPCTTPSPVSSIN